MSAVAFVEFLFDLHNSLPVLKSALVASAAFAASYLQRHLVPEPS